MARLAAALAVVLLAGLPLAAPAAADVGTVPGGTATTLSRSGATHAVFPMTLTAGVAAPSVRPVVVSVARDGVQSTAEGAAVRVTWTAAAPAMVVDVPANGLPRAGTYVVTVKLLAGRQTQLVALTLTRPAATRTVPTAVPVVVERPFLKLPGWHSRPPLTVTLGPDDTLTALTGAQLTAADGTVTIDPVDVSGAGPANRTVTLPYELTEDFPLGTTTRTVTLSSPQLTEAKTVTFEVTVRRSRWLICALVVLGLLAGWGVRGVLAPLRGRLEMDRRAQALRDEVERLRGESEDRVHHEQLNAISGRLAGLRGSAAKRKTAIDEEETALTEVVADLDRRVGEQHARYAALAVLGGDWRLPDGLAAGLATVRNGLRTADERLAVLDADGARAQLDEVERAGAALARDGRDSLTLLRTAVDTLVEAIGDRTQGAIGHLRRKLALLRTDAEPAAAADAGAVLTAVDATEQRRRDLPAAVDDYAAETSEVRDVLLQAPRPPDLTALEHALAELPRDGDLDALADAVPGVLREVERAVRAALPAGPDAEVEAALNAGNVRAAAARAAGTGTLGDETAPTVAGTEETAPPKTPEVPAVPPRRTPRTPAQPGFVSRALGLGAWLAVNVAQFVLLGAILVALAYALHSEKWTGTAADMVAVLTWAFAIDVSVGGVTAALAANTAPQTAG